MKTSSRLYFWWPLVHHKGKAKTWKAFTLIRLKPNGAKLIPLKIENYYHDRVHIGFLADSFSHHHESVWFGSEYQTACWHTMVFKSYQNQFDRFISGNGIKL